MSQRAATGSLGDFANRLGAVLPRRWFADDAPVLAALLSGFGQSFADVWSLLSFVRRQTRVATSTGVFLDIAANDFLAALPRRQNETDAQYAGRLRREVLRPRNTRPAIVQVLQDLTGNSPTVIRPSNPADTGGIGVGGIGIGVAGAYGSLVLPFQSFVTIARGTAPGTAGARPAQYGQAGIGSPNGGIGVGALAYGDGSPAQGAVTDADIYAAVASVTPEGHINWVQITGADALPGPFLAGEGRIGIDFLAAS